MQSMSLVHAVTSGASPEAETSGSSVVAVASARPREESMPTVGAPASTATAVEPDAKHTTSPELMPVKQEEFGDGDKPQNDVFRRIWRG